MSDEMLEQIMLIEAGGRGTGRTTRAVNSLREWAVAHPDLTGVMVTHDASFASTLKQRHFDDLPNVRVVGIGQSQSLRGQHIGALEVDHFAMKRMVMDLEASRTKLRAEISQLTAERDALKALKPVVVGTQNGTEQHD